MWKKPSIDITIYLAKAAKPTLHKTYIPKFGLIRREMVSITI